MREFPVLKTVFLFIMIVPMVSFSADFNSDGISTWRARGR